jgi:holo-[acyl-carrier protein] synthase
MGNVPLRVGVDMIEIDRVARAAERHGERFYARLFTANERALCDGQAHRLAARIAAKEAVSKALGTGIGEVRWVDIEIEGDERGRPILRLHGAAARIAVELGLSVWEISLSHNRTQAIAFVVALCSRDADIL